MIETKGGGANYSDYRGVRCGTKDNDQDIHAMK